MFSSGPCYRGICLPRNILDLFPESNYIGTYVSYDLLQEFGGLESNNLSALSVQQDKSQELPDDRTKNSEIRKETGTELVRTTSAASISSDLSSNIHRWQKKLSGTNDELGLRSPPDVAVSYGSTVGSTVKHFKSECLNCHRKEFIRKIKDKTSLTIKEPRDFTSLNGKGSEAVEGFYSPDSIISEDSAHDTMPERISNAVLRNVFKMANPIMFKACRKVLMELRQKYPESFKDICLYSEVCRYMSLCSYRIMIRRFIQEIFLDLSFESFTSDNVEVLKLAQRRLTDQNLLDNSKMLPLSPPTQSSPATLLQQPSTSSSSSIPTTLHKLHSLKSPLLASVYETSVENLVDSPPKFAKDEVDAFVTLRSPEKEKSSPSGSTQVKAEVHPHRRDSDESTSDSFEPFRRRRFKTLELDLSCTKNKFPIKHRSPTAATGPLATSTLRRPVSLNVNWERGDQQPKLYKSGISSSDHSFEASSRRPISSPISPPLGTLFCEQRLLTSSRSEATLSNKKKHDKKVDDRSEKK